MSFSVREARLEDLQKIVEMLSDDFLGKSRETDDLADYREVFQRMQASGNNTVYVGEIAGEVVATYQLILIEGLSISAAKRAELEAVRVDKHLRGQGIGHLLIEDALKRAKQEGCKLVQLTTNQARVDAHRFYEDIGFKPTHLGFKLFL